MNKITKNPDVFTDDYIPNEILYREKELRKIELVLKRDQIVDNLTIVGPTGTGKTASVRWALHKIGNVLHVYMSCYPALSLKKLFAQVATKLRINVVQRDTVFSLMDKLRPVLDEPLFLILDDVDRINRRSDLHSILALQDTFPKLLFVLITNKLNFFRELEDNCEDVLRRIAPSPIFFREYNVIELHRILLDRCREGLEDGVYQEKDINFLSANVKNAQSGDARLGIRAIKSAVERVLVDGRDKITEDDLKYGLSAVVGADLFNQALALSDSMKSLLVLVFQSPGRIFKIYQHLYEKYVYRPLDKSNIWRNFNKLVELGFIYPIDKGKRTVYAPQISDDDAKRLQYILEEDLLLDHADGEIDSEDKILQSILRRINAEKEEKDRVLQSEIKEEKERIELEKGEVKPSSNSGNNNPKKNNPTPRHCCDCIHYGNQNHFGDLEWCSKKLKYVSLKKNATDCDSYERKENSNSINRRRNEKDSD